MNTESVSLVRMCCRFVRADRIAGFEGGWVVLVLVLVLVVAVVDLLGWRGGLLARLRKERYDASASLAVVVDDMYLLFVLVLVLVLGLLLWGTVVGACEWRGWRNWGADDARRWVVE